MLLYNMWHNSDIYATKVILQQPNHLLSELYEKIDK